MNRKARIARCYTDQVLSGEGEIELDKRSSHHLSTVLRTKIGTPVRLFNGDGNEYAGELIATGKKTRVLMDACYPGQLESPLQVTLIQAIARGDKMDGIVQKATELGVNIIQPVYTRQSITKLDANRAERKRDHWQNIAISACEQCGRCVLPTILPIESLRNSLATLDNSTPEEQRWVLSPVGEAKKMAPSVVRQVSLLVGPESGFDEDELTASRNAKFTELQLGPRVLRTETAGPAAIAVIQARYGDFN